MGPSFPHGSTSMTAASSAVSGPATVTTGSIRNTDILRGSVAPACSIFLAWRMQTMLFLDLRKKRLQIFLEASKIKIEGDPSSPTESI